MRISLWTITKEGGVSAASEPAGTSVGVDAGALAAGAGAAPDCFAPRKCRQGQDQDPVHSSLAHC